MNRRTSAVVGLVSLGLFRCIGLPAWLSFSTNPVDWTQLKNVPTVLTSLGGASLSDVAIATTTIGSNLAAETAACLGIPEDTVKTRLHRANTQLRQALRGELSSLIDDVFPFAGARCDGLMRRVLARLGRLGALPGLAPAEKPLTPTVDQQETPL